MVNYPNRGPKYCIIYGIKLKSLNIHKYYLFISCFSIFRCEEMKIFICKKQMLPSINIEVYLNLLLEICIYFYWASHCDTQYQKRLQRPRNGPCCDYSIKAEPPWRYFEGVCRDRGKCGPAKPVCATGFYAEYGAVVRPGFFKRCCC